MAVSAEYSLENVRRMLRLMYAPDQAQAEVSISAVDEWLITFKRSSLAWNTSWILLEAAQTQFELLFAAACIRDKICHEWVVLALDSAHVTNCCEHLLSQAARSGVTIIHQALAALMIQNLAQQCDLFAEILASCLRSNQERVFLQVLTQIPFMVEKCNVRDRPVSGVKLLIAKHYNSQVIELFQRCLHTCDHMTALHIIELFASWVDMELTIAQLLPIIDCLLLRFNSHKMIEAALVLADKLLSSPLCLDFPSHVFSLVWRLLQFCPVYYEWTHSCNWNCVMLVMNVCVTMVTEHTSLLVKTLCPTAACVSPSDAARMMSFSDLCRISASISANCPNIVHKELSPGERFFTAKRLIYLLLELSSLPGAYPIDESVSFVSFSAWYSLRDSGHLLEECEKDLFVSIVSPVFRRLVDAFLAKCVLPSQFSATNDRSYSNEDIELFQSFREDVVDFFGYSEFVAGDYFLDVVHRFLRENIPRLTNPGYDWRRLECVLHALTAVKDFNSTNKQYCSSILSCLNMIYSAKFMGIVPLIQKSLAVIESCHAFIADDSQCLSGALSLLTSVLSDGRLVSEATLALRTLCEQNPSLFVLSSAGLVDAIHTLVQRRLGVMDVCRLMFVVGVFVKQRHCVSPSSHLTHQMELAESLCTDAYTRLEQSLGRPFHLYSNTATVQEACDSLEVVSSILSGVAYSDCSRNTDSQAAQIVSFSLKIVLVLLSNKELFTACAPLAAAVCNILTACLSATLDCNISQDFISHLLDIFYHIYQQTFCLEIFTFLKKILILYIDDARFNELLGQLYSNFSHDVIDHLLASRDLSASIDYAECFLSAQHQLMRRYLVKLLVFMTDTDVVSLIALIGNCVCQSDRRLHRSACSLLRLLVDNSASSPSLRRSICDQGPHLCSALFIAIGVTVARNELFSCADTILSLRNGFSAELRQWLHQVLFISAFPSELSTQQMKTSLVDFIFSTSGAQRNVMRQKIYEFSSSSRGLTITDHPI